MPSGAVDHITFRDALDHAQDFMRANPSSFSERLTRQAVLSAKREIGHNHAWSYYFQEGRLNLNAPFSSGTISYDHTGGTYERELILTPDSGGETFPTWATFGHVEIAGVYYRVAEWRSTTQIQLSIHSNPGADIAAGTAFTLYRDCYVLPVDFLRCDQMYAEVNCNWITFIDPADWARRRHCTRSSGVPRYFTVKGSTDFQGCMEACFDPYPDQDQAVDFMYQRRPRNIEVENYETGTVTTSAGTKTITGNGTAFEELMVGAIIRISENKRDSPTSKIGDNVYAYERMVMQIDSPTQITVDQNVPVTLSSVKYVISSVIDIEQGSMGTLFLRCLEAQIGKVYRLSDRKELQDEYDLQLIRAREADARSTEFRAVGGKYYRRTLTDHQYGHGADIV